MKTLQSEDYWDIGLAVLLIIVSILTLIGISGVKVAKYEPLGPAFFPKALSYIFFIMAGILVVKVFFRRMRSDLKIEVVAEKISTKEQENESTPRHPWLVVLAIGMISLFIASLNVLGFRVSALIFIVSLGLILIKFEKSSNQKRRFISLVIIALVLSFGLFYVFREILGVRVP